MPIFYYKAKNKSGHTVSGTVDSGSVDAAAEALSVQNLAIISISQRPVNPYAFLANFFVFNKVSSKDLVIFFRQLAVMLEANLPIVKALRILSEQAKNENLKNIIAGLADEIDGGSPLSASMNFYPEVFSKFYVNIIKSGETSGRLSEVMDYLADQKEKDYDLEAKVKGAMIYPAFIVAVLVVVGFIVVAFVIPNITAVLVESGVALPLLTRILITVANFLRSFWWLVVLLAICFSGLWLYWIKTPSGRNFYDEMKLRLPIFGTVFQNIYVVRICLSFATLVKGGVPIALALDIVKDVVDNAVYAEILGEAVRSVDEGNQVSEAFTNQKYVPIIVSQMISIGEESGKLDEVLERAADFYAREIDNTVRNLSNLIEPIIMVVLGLAVGLFVAAVILPMWQLSSSF